MNMSLRSFVAKHMLLALFAAASLAATSTSASADESKIRSRSDAIDRIQLFDSLEDNGGSGRTLPSKVERRTASEIRQDRALYRSRQRMLRHEHNLWMGYTPSRPQWSGIPTMNSRYPRPTIYVPVYVR